MLHQLIAHNNCEKLLQKHCTIQRVMPEKRPTIINVNGSAEIVYAVMCVHWDVFWYVPASRTHWTIDACLSLVSIEQFVGDLHFFYRQLRSGIERARYTLQSNMDSSSKPFYFFFRGFSHHQLTRATTAFCSREKKNIAFDGRECIRKRMANDKWMILFFNPKLKKNKKPHYLYPLSLFR